MDCKGGLRTCWGGGYRKRRAGQGDAWSQAGAGSLCGSCTVLMLPLRFRRAAAARGHPRPQAKGPAGCRAAGKGTSPRCCSMLVVLACTVLAMVCYAAAAVLCRAAPRCAGLHHAVLQLPPCCTGHAVPVAPYCTALPTLSRTVLCCIVPAVPCWAASCWLCLTALLAQCFNLTAMPCHAMPCRTVPAMPCHAAWCCPC